MSIENTIFVAFNRQVFALDRNRGDILWQWKADKGNGFVNLFLDGDRLIAAVSGYIYCLDSSRGTLLWSNPMKGHGLGVTSIASVRGNLAAAASEVINQSQRSNAAGGAGGAAGF